MISTDTAFLVGTLALIGPRVPGRLRVFLLALAVVDDIGALSIIALVYTENFTPLPLLIAAAGLIGVYFTRYLRRGRGPVYVSLAIVVWLAFLASGVHPTLAGVAIALLVPVYRPNRTDVEHALELARTFRQSHNTRVRPRRREQPARIHLDQRAPPVGLRPYVAYVGQTLARPVDPARDHVLGAPDAPYTIVEYGDFRCGFCLKASGSILEVRDVLGDRLRYVWRHAPLEQIHPNALAGAEASEAAAAQSRFFDFAHAIFDDQDNQRPSDIIRIAHDLGVDVEQFEKDLISAEVTGRVRDDLLDAEAMNITAVPTLFINDRRHIGPYDAQSLLRALTARTDTPVAE